MATASSRVLVIAAAGLARFVPALGTLAAIRASHHGSVIVLLTAPDLVDFAATAPYFDEVWGDSTLGSRDIRTFLSLRRRLRESHFDRIYDLDATAHTRRLFWLLYGLDGLPFRRAALPWSGAIPGTALCHADLRRDAMHMVDRWAAQLRIAGISGVLRSDMSWVARQVKSFNVPFRMAEPFILVSLDPGPAGSWPADHYGELARMVAAEGKVPVLVGTNPRPELAPAIAREAPSTVDLTAKAAITDLVILAWAAAAAVGPDSGVLHLTAAAGCRSVVLFDGSSDPALVGQRGDKVIVLRRPHLTDIPVGEVIAALHRDLAPRGTSRHRPLA